MNKEVDEYYPPRHAIKYYEALLFNLKIRLALIEEKLRVLREKE